jgi:hypothetical protein
MPLGLDPDATINVSLKSDMQKPEDVRPAFAVRFPTPRRVRAMTAILKEIEMLPKSGAENWSEIALAKMREVFQLSVTGWSNMIEDGVFIPFSIDALTDTLSFKEQWELSQDCLYEPRVREADFFNSGSQPALAAGESAKNAEAASV